MMKHTVMLEYHEWKYVTVALKRHADLRWKRSSASRYRVLYEKLRFIDLYNNREYAKLHAAIAWEWRKY